jgi:RNA recognition motif-containing protein
MANEIGSTGGYTALTTAPPHINGELPAAACDSDTTNNPSSSSSIPTTNSTASDMNNNNNNATATTTTSNEEDSHVPISSRGEPKGPPSGCLFVASLSEESAEDALASFFGQHGTVLKIKLLKDRSSRPYAFVQYQVCISSLCLSLSLSLSL